jgi:hypothetical protein
VCAEEGRRRGKEDETDTQRYTGHKGVLGVCAGCVMGFSSDSLGYGMGMGVGRTLGKGWNV